LTLAILAFAAQPIIFHAPAASASHPLLLAQHRVGWADHLPGLRMIVVLVADDERGTGMELAGDVERARVCARGQRVRERDPPVGHREIGGDPVPAAPEDVVGAQIETQEPRRDLGDRHALPVHDDNEVLVAIPAFTARAQPRRDRFTVGMERPTPPASSCSGPGTAGSLARPAGGRPGGTLPTRRRVPRC
jgi:hypothetical protein